MQKIGMIGGLSWVSTAEYYKRINELMQARLGGVASARIVLESVDRQDYVAAVIDRGDEAAACDQIAASAQALQAAGADFVVITCNDVHRFVPQIEPALSIPFLHIAAVTGEAIAARGLKRPAVLGVRKTMESDFYPEIFARYGLEAVIPVEAEKRFIHESIYDELVHNRFLDRTRALYRGVIEDLGARGADCVALACTEIPLLISPEQSPLPAFSTTELHCRAAVDRALTGHHRAA
ncbi:aspartate/glutamate racemase family protein [Acuticoccus sp. I52.16.1]|uniref:aspartate/glutamate racemase family protein n=1 Tax=Acuticoccus sp. I52.16.1 TaxID=2928472 RepID=UPI001FD313ED|nr:amino acid racemase [Acuticoccus sp. I52.16.1]UOM35495.1 amino acid racemase [Acuticoccus sp. I52.16.1]